MAGQEIVVVTEVGPHHTVRHSLLGKATRIVDAEDVLRTQRSRRSLQGTSFGLPVGSRRRAIRTQLEAELRDAGEWMAFE